MGQIAFLTQLISISESKNSVLFVFDIDSTLYNVSPRNIEIIKDYAQTNAQNLTPTLQSALMSVTHHYTDWGIKTPLLRLNLLNPDMELLKNIKKHWNEFFFSGKFLHHDEEYPGAVDFVNQLSKHAPTFYLTGRDVQRMGNETLKQLSQSEFPTDPHHNKLILKPNKEMLDHEYKLEELKKLALDFDVIYFFENEPIILNEVVTHFSEDKVIPICIASTHSGRAEINPKIKIIQPDYRLKEDL